jgi:FkbM family methyltransferase
VVTTHSGLRRFARLDDWATRDSMNAIPFLRSIGKRNPFVHRTAVWTRDKVRTTWYQLVGLDYFKGEITDGPNKGLFFYAARRVHYSRDFWNGKSELQACQFMQHAISENAVCYDIGANLGYHTLIMARQASRGIVFAFEPLPEAFLILSKNMAANQVRNVVLLNEAVTETGGSVSLGHDRSIDQAAIRWADDRDPMHRTFTRPSTSVDGFVRAGNPAPTFIKIDVEGAEGEVLSGAADTLRQHRPLILCETHGEASAVRLYQLLRQNDYQLFNVSDRLTTVDSVADMPRNMHDGHVVAYPAGVANHI